MRFNDARTYTIQIQGRVQEEDISRIIPQRFVIEHVAGTNTLITVQTDQSGMVGVVRHLHSLGMILIMVGCRNENLPNTGSGTKGDM